MFSFVLQSRQSIAPAVPTPLTTGDYIVGALLFLLLVAIPYLYIRNNKVCEFAVKLVREDFETFERLPSYFTMVVLKFWVWPLERFIPDDQ